MNPEIKQTLQSYGLKPNKWERIGNVFKVECYQGTFALKQSQFPADSLDRFLQTMRYFEREQIYSVVPLYPNRYGEFAVQGSKATYYLMPWVLEDTRHAAGKEERILETLGLMHRFSERMEESADEYVTSFGEQVQRKKERELLELERYADEIERKHYFSPFELAILTHFPFIHQLYQESQKHFNTWLEISREKQQVRTVRCHGCPSVEHAVIDSQGNTYLINFEKTRDDSPAWDLAYFFRDSFEKGLWDNIDAYRWMTIYEKQFPLAEADRSLFLSHLLSPYSLVSPIKEYQTKRSRALEKEYVRLVELHVRLYKRLYGFSSHLYEQHYKQSPS
ncbi:hypothetical protein ACFPU1_07750 [Thalassorhabdus alkalitolerans]|uniref:Spore coat protein YsxE n=1 Tax=Thalassorhabdus alkalitolerans TaxID=2282697 RepID=A0ABW0YPM0_9BACI